MKAPRGYKWISCAMAPLLVKKRKPRKKVKEVMGFLRDLLTAWRDGIPTQAGITEVFLAALGIDGKDGYQCELGFGDTTTMSFQAATLQDAIDLAHQWALETYG